MKRAITAGIMSIALAISLTACITTNVKGFTDREYADYRVKKVVVRAPNANLDFGALIEQSFVEEFNFRGIHAASFMTMFPPTREWTDEDVANELEKNGFDSILYVILTGSDTNTDTVGFHNTGTARVYNNSVSYSSYSTPVRSIRRYTSTRARLYEVRTARTVWVGDSSTSAGGLAFIGDASQAHSISANVVAALRDGGHLGAKE